MEDNLRKSKRRRTKGRNRRVGSPNFTKFLGFLLIIFGLSFSLYLFGAVNNVSDLFSFPNVKDYIHLWPILLVVLGFFYVIRAYIKNNDEKWD